ncbi:sensor histidine kinase [Clostridium hydrogenum]|uniref:sensor histidine kinase n=1 Tax=Clostridium hydrogenum TaxID=2855764 RepID=UPI001F33FDE9|nr:ATP-binding protein [Clostridium hydrogenum]
MKNRINKLLFGSVTRELLFVMLFFISISAFSDVVHDIMLYGIHWFISSVIRSFISGIIPGIAIVLVVYLKFKNKIKELLLGTRIRELLSFFFLFLISLRVLSNIITILILIYLLVRRKAEYIKSICHGIKIISEGNLDFKIKVSGHDELAILAEEINNMSLKLKNKIQEEKNAERLKSELITNVSHDLRTPLTSLIGYIQLAVNDNMSTEEKDKYAKVSLEKSQKLKILIDDLFEYSKLESGGVKLEKVKVDIIEIMEQSIGELSIQASEKGVRFNKNFKNGKLELLIDPSKIARVFTNIIENAVKYSVEGSNININLYETGKNIIINFENVVDSVLEENLEKVFNRFYRTDESRNSETAGSGLGLAIAKNIVELHGGRIWAQSENNRFIINVELMMPIV